MTIGFDLLFLELTQMAFKNSYSSLDTSDSFNYLGLRISGLFFDPLDLA